MNEELSVTTTSVYFLEGQVCDERDVSRREDPGSLMTSASVGTVASTDDPPSVPVFRSLDFPVLVVLVLC